MGTSHRANHQVHLQGSLSLHNLTSTMAALFAGKWDLLEATGIEELLTALGAGNEFLQLAKTMKENDEEIVQQIDVTGDKISLTYFRNRERAAVEAYELGKPIEVQAVDGRKVNVSVKVDGNKMIFTETGPYTCTTTLEVNGDIATSTITCGSTSATAKLKKL